jgi:coenzyme PQQ precursor peptide PqqA
MSDSKPEGRASHRGALSESEAALSKSEVSVVESDTHAFALAVPHLRQVRGRPRFNPGANLAPDYLQVSWETRMTWKTPKIVEVSVGMEINMYACASRK